MRVHLTTVVGAHVGVLPFMLRHYAEAGISSFFVNVHLSHSDDKILDEVKAITSGRGIEIASVTVGPWNEVLLGIYNKSRAVHPNDWYVIADQDELQHYSNGLFDLLSYCDRKGYDYISGCFVDRIGPEGSFVKLNHSLNLNAQFPLGGFLTFPIIGGDPRKVVAAKGHVRITRGQHVALNGNGCPMEDAYIQVHHFKWIEQIIPHLERRMNLLKNSGEMHWTESYRLTRYYQQNNARIDVTDPQLLVSECCPEYKQWPQVKEIVATFYRSIDKTRRNSGSEPNQTNG